MPKTDYTTRVCREWLDYNGHMNVAYYTLAFDQAAEVFFSSVGLDEAHARETGNSWMVLEAHLTYQNEARLDDELMIATQILDLDSKRIHLFQLMRQEKSGVLLATNEQMILHVNLTGRRTAPFDPPASDMLQALFQQQKPLECPPEVGRVISLNARKPRCEQGC